LDLCGANTEASLRFHRSHEQLNRSLKVQMLGLGLLADEIDVNRQPAELKERLYRRSDWLWGGMPDWSDPQAIVIDARRDIGQAGVVRAFSAFDLFMDEIAADLIRWLAFTNQEQLLANEKSQEPDRAARFYHRIGGTPKSVEFLWPVYRYFRFARDCIVHRDGRASNALLETYKDPALMHALDAWVEQTGEMTAPEVTSIDPGCLIDFNHRQAISASSVLRLVAFDINRQVIKIVGVNGLVYFAAFHILFDPDAVIDLAQKQSMLKALVEVLSDRYRVRFITEKDASRMLRELGLTKSCNDVFRALKGAREAKL
jgi:hypothetical protein